MKKKFHFFLSMVFAMVFVPFCMGASDAKQEAATRIRQSVFGNNNENIAQIGQEIVEAFSLPVVSTNLPVYNFRQFFPQGCNGFYAKGDNLTFIAYEKIRVICAYFKYIGFPFTCEFWSIGDNPLTVAKIVLVERTISGHENVMWIWNNSTGFSN